jgi:hypothetical protein
MLSTTTLAQVGNFDTTTINQLRPALGGGVDAISAAGACSLTSYVTELTISGTKAYTLAAPTVAGQRKRIVCVAATAIPAGTLTITSPDDTAGFVCATTFVFSVVGQAIELIATAGLKWRCVRVQRAGVKATITAGTTVLTGLNLFQAYSLAVDGTDAGTGVGGLPNGSAVGERCSIVCELADNIPVGSLTGAYLGMFGTAYTIIGAIGVVASTTVVGDCALLEWNGSAWLVVYQNGCTLS